MAKSRPDDIPMMTRDEMIALLEKFVVIKSVSNKRTLNEKVQAIVSREIRAAGMSVKLIKSTSKTYGPLLVAEHPGQRKEWITLLAHSDVVNAGDDFFGFTVDKGDKYAMGPGVIDCKGGIVIIIAALKAYLKACPKHEYSIRFICSPNEEVGSLRFHNHLRKYGNESKVLLSFEPGFKNGDYIDSRSGNRWYSIEVKGRQAHSGREYQHGVNALEAISYKLSKICQLTDVKNGTLVSATHVECSGGNFNTIPKYCKAYVDTRFTDNERGDLLHENIMDVLRTVEVTAYSDFMPASLVVDVVDYSPAFAHSDASSHLGLYYAKLLKRHGRSNVVGQTSYGSADCNLMMNPSIIFLGGMGAVGSGQHTRQEKILFSTLVRRAKAALGLLFYIDENVE